MWSYYRANGDTLNAKLRDPKSRVRRAISSNQALEAWLEDAYLAALSRPPTPAELETVRAAMTEGTKEESRAIMEDTVWALLSSREFLFNH